jgi:hypothetical protein
LVPGSRERREKVKGARPLALAGKTRFPVGPGSARPLGRHCAKPKIAPSWPPASRKGTGGNAMPCHSSGRTVRARRPRPSEKTALRGIPGFSPQGHPSLKGPPAEGRAPHTRRKGIGSTRACPRGRPGPARPCRENGIPRHTFGHTMRTHRVRPSEKTAFRVICGFAPVRPSPRRLAIPRRGGLRTPVRKALRQPQHCHALATGFL